MQLMAKEEGRWAVALLNELEVRIKTLYYRPVRGQLFFQLYTV